MTDTHTNFAWQATFSDMHGLMRPSVVREILKLATKPDMFLFGGGLPDPTLLPAASVATATQNILRASPSLALQYGATDGVGELREEIARLATSQGRPSDSHNILVTSGSQQAIDLLAGVFLNPGDAIAITRPCYLGALQIFERYSPRYIEISCDDEGPCLEDVERALSRRPAFFYFVSIFQNPTGATVSRERAEAIVALCHRYDVPIIEDGAYQELFFSERPASLRRVEAEMLAERGQDYETRGRVVFLGTFSKMMAPGLRLGWLEAPQEVTQAAALLKQATDLHTSTINQMIAAEFLREHAERHWHEIRSVYRRRRDAMVEAVDAHLAPWMVSRTDPAGGFFVWVEVDPNIDTMRLLRSAIERQGVIYTPGEPFFALNPASNFMRLSFSNVAEGTIGEGIARLAKVLDAADAHDRPRQAAGM